MARPSGRATSIFVRLYGDLDVPENPLYKCTDKTGEGRLLSKTAEIFSVVAASTGLTFAEVQNIGRYVRTAGYFTKETRAKDSPRASNRDVACLIVAVLSGLSVRTCAQSIDRMNETQLAGQYQFKKKFIDYLSDEELVEFLGAFDDEGMSFIDALEHFIAFARSNLTVAQQAFEQTSIYLDRRRWTGGIWLDVWQEGRVSSMTNELFFLRNDELFTGTLGSQESMEFKTIIDVARCMNREEMQ